MSKKAKKNTLEKKRAMKAMRMKNKPKVKIKRKFDIPTGDKLGFADARNTQISKG